MRPLLRPALRPAIEATVFLTAAAALHLLALSLTPAPGNAANTAGDAGQGGADRLTLRASSDQLAALVQRWDTPPVTAPTVTAPSAPPQPDQALAPPRPAPVAPPVRATAPGLALPAPDGSAQPQLDTAPPPPPQAQTQTQTQTQTPKQQPKPQPKQQPKPKQTPSTATARQTAAGSGGAAQAGQANTGSANLSAAQTRSLTGQWASQILTRIERKKRYPSAAGRRDGTVGLRLTLSRNGTLRGVTVTASAGHSALDRAALLAVQRAGRFPAAPQALGGQTFTFDLKIRFDG